MIEVSWVEILASIATAAGGGGAVAYLIFRSLGAAWLDGLFNRKLETLRHDNAKELQNLRANVDGALEATIRVQKREFDALSEAWHLANVAYGAAADYVSQFQTYHDIGRCSDEMAAEYLQSLDLMESTRQEILDAEDRTERLKEAVDSIRGNEARSALVAFNNYLLLNEIFIDQRLVEDFKSIACELSKALSKKNLALRIKDFSLSSEGHDIIVEIVKVNIEAMAPTLRAKFFGQKIVS